MKNRVIILCLCSAALALSGCESFTLPLSHRIGVRVSMGKTKGYVTTTDSLMTSGAFSMAAYVSDDYIKRDEDDHVIMDGDQPKLFDGGLYFSGDGNVTLNSGIWSISGEPKWISGVDTHFWAWHPVTAAGRTISGPLCGTVVSGGEKYPYTGELGFSYETPTPDGETDADRALDLIFAYAQKKYVEKNSPSESDKTIDLTFHHALPQVRFCVSTDDGTYDKSLKIKSISITNLKTSGDAVFSDSDQFDWDNLDGNAEFGQIYDADFSTSTVSGWNKGTYEKNDRTFNLYTCQNVFFMIPQEVSKTSNRLTVVFEYDGKEIEKSAPITGSSDSPDTWHPDHYYTYKLLATTVGRDVVFSVSLVGWTNRKEEIFI